MGNLFNINPHPHRPEVGARHGGIECRGALFPVPPLPNMGGPGFGEGVILSCDYFIALCVVYCANFTHYRPFHLVLVPAIKLSQVLLG